MAKRVPAKDPIYKEWPSGFLLLKTDFAHRPDPRVTFGVHPLSYGAQALCAIFKEIEGAEFGSC
jgi:hypothetical protein